MIKKIASACLLFAGCLSSDNRQTECCGIVGGVLMNPTMKKQESKLYKQNYRFSLEHYLC